MEREVTVKVPEKVKILGISGSPRKGGNTAGMVKYCLEWAEKTGFAETDYVTLADYNIQICNGCLKCFGYMAPADDPPQCYEYNDDSKILNAKVLDADGILLGFPVYVYGIPGLVKNFLDKLHHFGPMSLTPYSGALMWKAMGIISQGGQVYGGQELNHHAVAAVAQSLGMYVVTAWPTIDAPMPSSSHVGGMVTLVDAMNIYGRDAWRKENTRTVPPASGSRNERTLKNLGRHLAVAALSLKLGRQAFLASGYEEPEKISFTRYAVKPKSGSYVEKLINEGKMVFVSGDELEERKAAPRKR